METSLGAFNIGLYGYDAPKTVENFLNYVSRGDYNNTVIHRNMPGFIIQGGGYECCTFFGQVYHFPTDEAVRNEYDSSRSNLRGTIAMAKLPLTNDSGNPIPGGGPDSATSEWFFNLANNNAPYDPNKSDREQSLDYQNGGFTVFGHVLDSGMDVVDAIATLSTITMGAYSEDQEYLSLSNFPIISASSLMYVNRICINTDGDSSCPETENMAPGEDGNGDDEFDRNQPNVTTFLTSLSAVATLATDSGMRFSSVTAIDKNTALAWLKGFTSPQNQTLNFNNGMLRFTAVGDTGADGKKTITLHDGAATRPNSYYAYGPTADNPTPHWYDFSYDGETGAKIEDNKIILYFVDNKRGDDDYTTDNSITHTGAQAVVTSTTTSSSPASGGCSISTAPRGALRAGDWMLVSLFLAVVALVRRRTRCSGRVGIAHR